MEETFLTVAEVAGLLKLNEQTVRNWIDQGDLPAIRVGPRRVRIRQSDLDEFLAAGSGASPRPDSQRADVSAGEAPDQLLSRTALAQRLGRSLRWVDARVTEGMPSEPPSEVFPHRRFRLSEVEAWIRDRAQAGSRDQAQTPGATELKQFARLLSATLRSDSGQDVADLSAALKAVADAANRLADALDRSGT